MLGTISSTLSLIHPNRLLDHLGVGVLLTSQRQEVQAGGGDALVAELARDLADLPLWYYASRFRRASIM